jgi:hypothetical protein
MDKGKVKKELSPAEREFFEEYGAGMNDAQIRFVCMGFAAVEKMKNPDRTLLDKVLEQVEDMPLNNDGKTFEWKLQGKGKSETVSLIDELKPLQEENNKLMNKFQKEELEKYYIPEISEFHVGFEYEWSEDGSKIWIEETADQDDVLLAYSSYEHNDEYNEEYRVKYLDREDIKSEGWIWEDSLLGLKSPQNYSFGDYWMICNYDKTVKIKKRGGETLFCGTIKNKSKFKGILQQVGILQR